MTYESPPTSPLENKVNLLLVDDHQLVLDGLKSMLEGHSYLRVLDTALTGEKAWSLIQANPQAYQLVVADISMPGISGIDLCQRIKEQHSHLRVLILSMHHEASYIRASIACEADGYMLKNGGQREFIKGLEAIMETGCYYAYDILPIIRADSLHNQHTEDLQELTPREMDVLTLILQEYTSKEIAAKLFISKQTVDSHRIRIMEKTASKSVVGLIKFAVRHRLIK